MPRRGAPVAQRQHRAQPALLLERLDIRARRDVTAGVRAAGDDATVGVRVVVGDGPGVLGQAVGLDRFGQVDQRLGVADLGQDLPGPGAGSVLLRIWA
ncbi:hypothetical protein GCM10025872_17530 [Barrientosiimonas endolithica]|uniref:Uncharacterized protein n=1 Tax=Barrientosiimonas endolithica TaxID=1535208 RepID=A0ABM8HBE1_9MICO|nr:hypothetical protein GCM10025872_17530 [Barrientosiimonas endolithica]